MFNKIFYHLAYHTKIKILGRDLIYIYCDYIDFIFNIKSWLVLKLFTNLCKLIPNDNIYYNCPDFIQKIYRYLNDKNDEYGYKKQNYY